MSRLPNNLRQYDYPTTQYCYEDTEGYVGDYSESDAMSDAPHLATHTQDVKEIYRRQTPAPQEHMYTPEYYYQPVATSPPVQNSYPTRKSAPSPPYRTRITLPMDRDRYIDVEQVEDFGDFVYRSTPQITTIPRSAPTQIPSASAMRSSSRRHPVAVRTPRYYKRATSGVYKGPSFLRLPVAYQPDPAVTRRIKRNTTDRFYQRQSPEVYYQTSKPLPRRISVGTTSETMDEMRKYDHCGDLNATNTKLDSVLAKYETVLGSDICKANAEKARIAQMFKPKVPLSIREKQERLRKQRNESMKNKEKLVKNNFQLGVDANTLEVEEITADVLDNILSDLDNQRAKLAKAQKEERACESCKEDKKVKVIKSAKKESDDKSVQCEQTKPLSTEGDHKDYPKSFNYEEIRQSLSKSKSRDFKEKIDAPATSNEENLQVPCSSTNVETLSRPSVTLKSKSNVVPRILVDDAMELHRTKSYVVNLIDQALSNHFGTNVSEKYAQKESSGVDQKAAMDMLKKQSDKMMDKDLCAEIAHALTESFITSPSGNGPQLRLDTKPESSSTCSCNKPEEAFCVKLLKQLRWGHLKHIQREIGKLENLERILDSCSADSF